jgi:hypothetical protein
VVAFLSPSGVDCSAGLLLGEHPPASGGLERVELPFQALTAGGHAGVADSNLGRVRRLGGEQVGGFKQGRHGCDLLRKRCPEVIEHARLLKEFLKAHEALLILIG